MKNIDITVACPIHDSFRVQQVAGMFDVPIEERSEQSFHVEVPDLGVDWQIGLIVGPSGSGKSTVAKELFGARLFQMSEWPDDRAVIDCFGDLPVKKIAKLFTAVGFSSPPSWIKPYYVLSNGEQFRCDLVRALLAGSEESSVQNYTTCTESVLGDLDRVVAFDEFSSVVDRNVAKIGSAAISRGIREDQIDCRFVAVTCHYDIAEWLEPDWVIDMATSCVTRRLLRRPRIQLEVFRCKHTAWRLFARHHYLTGSLSKGCRCFMATWNGNPVAFCASISLIGRKHRWRFSRLVVLPDYQGIGIGTAFLEAVAKQHRSEGHRINLTASHPAIISHCRNSPDYRAINVMKTGSGNVKKFIKNYQGSMGRSVVSFEYVGDWQHQ